MDTVVNIIIADDMEDIHQSLRYTLDSLNFNYDIIADFYDTASLKRYLRKMLNDDTNIADVLILDHYFGGNSQTGLEALPKITEYAPNLPVIFLTTFDDTYFIDASEKYHIDYINKPVKAYDLRYRIRTIMNRSEKWNMLQKELTENKELVQYLLDENEAQAEKYTIAPEISQLIQNIFPDIEFGKYAFQYMLQKKMSTSVWNRIFRVLKIIDWKNEANAGAGVKIQKFKSKLFSKDNVWEYRFSNSGRIFVQRRKDSTPLLLLLDPFHEYSDKI